MGNGHGNEGQTLRNAADIFKPTPSISLKKTLFDY
jgi:hypothetical protein